MTERRREKREQRREAGKEGKEETTDPLPLNAVEEREGAIDSPIEIPVPLIEEALGTGKETIDLLHVPQIEEETASLTGIPMATVTEETIDIQIGNLIATAIEEETDTLTESPVSMIDAVADTPVKEGKTEAMVEKKEATIDMLRIPVLMVEEETEMAEGTTTSVIPSPQEIEDSLLQTGKTILPEPIEAEEATKGVASTEEKAGTGTKGKRLVQSLTATMPSWTTKTGKAQQLSGSKVN